MNNTQYNICMFRDYDFARATRVCNLYTYEINHTHIQMGIDGLLLNTRWMRNFFFLKTFKAYLSSQSGSLFYFFFLVGTRTLLFIGVTARVRHIITQWIIIPSSLM